MQVPHCQPGVWPTDIPPARFAAHIQQALPTGCRVALLGLPDDLGVRLNCGRPGAAEGPTAFRAALARYGVAEPDPREMMQFNYSDTPHWKEISKRRAEWLERPVYPRVFDAGDVVPSKGDDEAALAETHDRVSAAAAALVEARLFPIAIGGGHDLTYAFIRGVSRGLKTLGAESGTAGQALTGTVSESSKSACIYLDPHLDVRPTHGSGMSFRKLLEEKIIGCALNVGFSPLVNSKEHVDWACRNYVYSSTSDEIRSKDIAELAPKPLLRLSDHIYCSFDIDVLDQSIAPGVSAMNPDGLTVGMAAKALLGITRISSLRCLDFMELCPPHDDRGRTARVAAHLFLIALSGLMQGPLAQERSP